MEGHYFNRTERTEWSIHDPEDLIVQGDTTINGNLRVDTVANDDTENRLIVWDTTANLFEYRNVSSLPVVNPFDQDLNTSDPVEFDQVNINDNFLLSTLNDSFTRLHQTPASNFNDKVFEFQSDTDTGGVVLRVNNLGQKSAGLKLTTQNIYDGNAFIQYETGTNRWFSGVNKTSNEYRIHYSPGDPTDNLYNAANERLSIDTSGNLTVLGTIDSDALVLQNVLNDDSETKLMTWDIVGKACKFRNVSSLPAGNPFNQDLNTSNTPLFQELYIGGTDNLGIGASSDSLSSFNQTPALTTGIKQYTFASETSDSPVLLEVINRDISGHSGILLHTTAPGGNQLVIYETPTGNQWTVGKQTSSESYRWNYSAAGSGDYLTVDANTKMSLSNTGVLSLNGVTLTPNSDSFTTFEQTPLVTTGGKVFAFSSESSNEATTVNVGNKANSLTGHSTVNLQTDTVVCNGTSGNQTVRFEKCGIDKWEIGHQSNTSTFRFNYGTGYDYLTDDSQTRMFLDTNGNLDIDGEFRINNNNLVIATISDSSCSFSQTPTVTTGPKDFIFSSESTTEPVQVAIRNFGTGPGAHTGVTLFNSAGGGNLFTKYYELSCCIWLSGFQPSTSTYRWNYDLTGSDDLDNNANTRMFLDTSGNLDINGALTSSPALVQTDGHVGTISSAGTLTKLTRTGISRENFETSGTIVVGAAGTYYHLPTPGWLNSLNLNTDWSATGAQLTYNGTDPVYIMVRGSVTFTGNPGNKIYAALFLNEGQISRRFGTIVNGNECTINVECMMTITNGTLVSLRLNDSTAVNNITVVNGFLNCIYI